MATEGFLSSFSNMMWIVGENEGDGGGGVGEGISIKIQWGSSHIFNQSASWSKCLLYVHVYCISLVYQSRIIIIKG